METTNTLNVRWMVKAVCYGFAAMALITAVVAC